MLRILNDGPDGGFNIKERELMRVRAKNRWLLRVPNGMKSGGFIPAKTGPEDEDEALQELAQALYPDGAPQAESTGNGEPMTIGPKPASPDLAPEVIAKRRERLEKLQAESAERWASKKRRRRTRGWAGLPADPPGPPRFPSETTIDEGKNLLQLDPLMYRQLRDHFQNVCEDMGIIKKTTAGAELWQAAKDRLKAESPHLQTVFYTDNFQYDSKNLALDVICTDVTKRMRTLERRMTIAEAKNALGVNPEESRQIRNAFYSLLKEDHFTSKLEAGDEHWQELKDRWIANLPILQQILAPGDADPQHSYRVKAMEVLCRDVMKRLRDDQTKRDPARKRPNQDEILDGTSAHLHLPSSNVSTASKHIRSNRSVTSRTKTNGISNGISTLASQALATAPDISQHQQQHKPNTNAYSDLQIDPSLLLAANDSSLLPNSSSHLHAQEVAYQQHPDIPQSLQDSNGDGPTLQGPIPVYFRLSPHSTIPSRPTSTRLWLATLTATSVEELKMVAGAKHRGARVKKIEGVVKEGREGGAREVSFKLDEDEELDAYLTHVGDLGGKATFLVELGE